MEANALQTYLGQPDVHRTILGGYSGPYSLGIGRDPRHSQPVLILQVISASQQRFPTEVLLGGEVIPIIVRTDFVPPRPLRAGS